MAGIGFELKKLMGKGNIVNMVAGTAYAIAVTIGPTILLAGTLMLMYIVLPYSTEAFADREFLSSTILYVFIFSMIITSPLNSVLSRYVADKIYQDKIVDIMPAINVGLALNMVLAFLACSERLRWVSTRSSPSCPIGSSWSLICRST